MQFTEIGRRDVSVEDGCVGWWCECAGWGGVDMVEGEEIGSAWESR